jgi:hypothetical protein
MENNWIAYDVIEAEMFRLYCKAVGNVALRPNTEDLNKPSVFIATILQCCTKIHDI